MAKSHIWRRGARAIILLRFQIGPGRYGKVHIAGGLEGLDFKSAPRVLDLRVAQTYLQT